MNAELGKRTQWEVVSFGCWFYDCCARKGNCRKHRVEEEQPREVFPFKLKTVHRYTLGSYQREVTNLCWLDVRERLSCVENQSKLITA